MATQTARYRTACAADCGVAIAPGDEIVMNAELEWEHADCPATADPLATSSPVCPSCNLAHAGDCW